MQIIWTLVAGFVIGAAAKTVMPGTDPGDVLVTTFLGIDGALLGALVGRWLGFYGRHDTGPTLIAAIFGAMILLGIYRLTTPRRHPIV